MKTKNGLIGDGNSFFDLYELEEATIVSEDEDRVEFKIVIHSNGFPVMLNFYDKLEIAVFILLNDVKMNWHVGDGVMQSANDEGLI